MIRSHSEATRPIDMPLDQTLSALDLLLADGPVSAGVDGCSLLVYPDRDEAMHGARRMHASLEVESSEVDDPEPHWFTAELIVDPESHHRASFELRMSGRYRRRLSQCFAEAAPRALEAFVTMLTERAVPRAVPAETVALPVRSGGRPRAA